LCPFFFKETASSRINPADERNSGGYASVTTKMFIL